MTIAKISLHRLELGAIFAAASCGLWLATTVAASPQSGASETQTPAFGEIVDVQLVNVEVWVTDRQGNPVTGLDAGDFEVREDGKIVDISNFSEIREALPGDPFAPGDPIEAPVEGVVQERPLELADLLDEPRQPEGAGFLALYFDELFSKPEGRKQLVEDLRTFVELRRVPPERVLILRQDKGLKVEANLGSSRAQLEAALDRLEEPSIRGLQTWADERNALRRLQEEWELEVVVKAGGRRNPCDWFPTKAFNLIQFHINSSRARIGETLEYLTDTAGFRAGLPGPKTLIYVSDGLALAPGKDLLSFAKSLCPGRQDDRRLDYLEGMGEAFRTLSRHANANRVTIYSIQALGLRSHLTATSASERGSKRTIQAISRYNSESRMQQQEGMSYLAEQTGGRAVFNRGAFIEELEKIAEDMTGFYSLAYAPTHGGDGLEHKIEVKVRATQLPDAKLRIRHRPGYRDKNQDQRMIERLQSALYLNLMANPLGVTLGAGEITAGDKDRLKVPLHVRVPVDEITFLPQQGGDFASLRVAVMTRDERHAKTSFKQEGYRLARPAEAGSDLTLSLVIDLDLEPGIHVIAFGVRDEATQVASFVATGLDIRRPAGEVGGAAAGGGGGLPGALLRRAVLQARGAQAADP